ncbi:MAG TPA: zf-HC2 domain-containing protein [Syntrophomonas sp.]|nr:zf-HC2 domain-containing protein [Syntrophomonas sp.]HRW12770.1 zf-HC2 domain-containing protein [Syntrophomonas sp.]
MNCQHYREMMFADFETELSPTDQNDLLQHLQTCESCRRHYDLTLRENEVLMDTSNIPAIDAGFNRKVLAQLQAASTNGQTLPRRRSRHLPAYSKAVAAAVLLLACLYVPGILPRLQDDRSIEQTAMVDHSQPSQKSLHNVRAGSEPTQAVEMGLSEQKPDESVSESSSQVNRESPQYPNHDEVNGAKNADTGTVLKAKHDTAEQTPELFMQTAAEPLAPHDGQGVEQSKGMEASRSLISSLRSLGTPVKPSINNTPAGFVLVETREINEVQTEYHFTDPNREKSFVIKLSPADAAAAGSIPAQEAEMYNDKETMNADMASIAVMPNEASKIMEYNGLSYQLQITSAVFTQEELAAILTTIHLDSPAPSLQP